MRPAFVREFAELALPTASLMLVAILAGIETVSPHSNLDEPLLFAIMAGGALGLVQGVLDHLRRRDHFFLHRPIPAGQLQGARSLAGVAACALGLAAFLLAHVVGTNLEIVQRREYLLRGVDFGALPEHFTAGEWALTGAMLLAAWAVCRFAVGTRRLLLAPPLLVVLGLGSWSLVCRAETAVQASLIALAATALFGLATWMRAAGIAERGRIRTVALLAVLLVMTLEGLFLLRGPLIDLLARSYPQVAYRENGEPLYFRMENGRDRDGDFQVYEFVDAQRNVLRTWSSREAPDANPLAGVLAQAAWFGPGPRYVSRLNNPRFSRRGPRHGWGRSWLETLASEFNGSQSNLRGSAVRRVRWAVENGRIVCRRIPDQAVLAGLGPDGFRRGAGAGEGERFGVLTHAWSELHFGEQESPRSSYRILLDRAGRRLYRIEFGGEKPGGDGDDPEPIRVDLTVHPLEAPGQLDPEREAVGLFAEFDGGIWVFAEDGTILGKWTLDPGEMLIGAHGARSAGVGPGLYFYSTGGGARPIKEIAVVFETSLGPAHPARDRRRVRILRPGAGMTVHEFVLEPVSLLEKAAAALAASFSLVRPPVLNLASAASDLPSSWRECSDWWWRDPWLANGRQKGWLALSLLLAGACGWIARSRARERCAGAVAVQVWTIAGLVFGPLGLAWMWLVLPRVPVEYVGALRRAVDLEESPSTAAPWPEPVPTGVEVFETVV